MREQCFEYVRYLELSACRRPFAILFILYLGNVNCVVDKAYLIVRSLVLKVVTIEFTKLFNKSNNFWSSIRNFNTISFNVSNGEPPFLNSVLEINHEQRSTFSNNIVFVTNITEWIVKFSTCQSVYAVYCYL